MSLPERTLEPPENPYMTCDECGEVHHEETMTLEQGSDKFLCGSCLETELINREVQ